MNSFEGSSVVDPFDVTKAVDFSDAEINSMWVDLPGTGFSDLVDPRSPIPVLLLGGKGSGRTHLMRRYSFASQKLRSNGEDLIRYICNEEKYLGVFMRCEGLNSGRFSGKGIDDEAWLDIFSYYIDLWLAEIALDNLSQVFFASSAASGEKEANIAASILLLFDDDQVGGQQSLAEIRDLLRSLRREVDVAVNNASLRRSVSSVVIRSSRSKLIFGLPRAFTENLVAMRDLRVVYLIDELENLTEQQQTYINTLIREKQAPVNLIVGARSYGYRTRLTLSAGEENRADAEYEEISLDDVLRIDDRYGDFARSVVQRRLVVSGFSLSRPVEDDRRELNALFETFQPSRFETGQLEFLTSKPQSERPHRMAFRRILKDNIGDVDGLTLKSALEIEKNLSFSEPLLEKFGHFLLYRQWARGENLLDQSSIIAAEIEAFKQRKGSVETRRIWSHYKGDLLAQLLRQSGQAQRYLGLENFITMSAGIPRHLIIVLKYVTRWSRFVGENPFRGEPISIAAQQQGVLQAANWFYSDASAVGLDSHAVQASVARLAEFFRQLRYSDKPIESSLVTFSVNEARITPEARARIRAAQSVSLLLSISKGQRYRNDFSVVSKYQLNPMVCPRFDLPLQRRGATHLSSQEANSIFGDEGDEAFSAVLRRRVASMNAPFDLQKRRNLGLRWNANGLFDS